MKKCLTEIEYQLSLNIFFAFWVEIRNILKLRCICIEVFYAHSFSTWSNRDNSYLANWWQLNRGFKKRQNFTVDYFNAPKFSAYVLSLVILPQFRSLSIRYFQLFKWMSFVDYKFFCTKYKFLQAKEERQSLRLKS